MALFYPPNGLEYFTQCKTVRFKISSWYLLRFFFLLFDLHPVRTLKFELFITSFVLLLLISSFCNFSLNIKFFLKMVFLDTLSRLRKVLSTPSLASTSAAESTQSNKMKGSSFKVYIHLTILKVLNPRFNENICKNLSSNSFRK